MVKKLVFYGLLTITAITLSAPRAAWGNSPASHVGQGSNDTVTHTVSTDSDSASTSSINDSSSTLVQIKREYQVATNTIAVSLPYCGQGGGASTVKMAFSFGDVSYTCQAIQAMPALLSLIGPKLERAKNETDPVRRLKLIKEAAHMMDAVYSIGRDVEEHLAWKSVTDKAWDLVKIVGVVIAIAIAL